MQEYGSTCFGWLGLASTACTARAQHIYDLIKDASFSRVNITRIAASRHARRFRHIERPLRLCYFCFPNCQVSGTASCCATARSLQCCAAYGKYQPPSCRIQDNKPYGLQACKEARPTFRWPCLLCITVPTCPPKRPNYILSINVRSEDTGTSSTMHDTYLYKYNTPPRGLNTLLVWITHLW